MFLFVIIEYIYSSFKKDTKYSREGTRANILTGIILTFISKKCTTLYLNFFSLIFLFHYTQNYNFELISFCGALLCADFCYYLFHRLHHGITFFWLLHHVHHSDNKLNLSTSYRISWIEQLYEFLFFIPLLIIGFNPTIVLLSFYTISIYQFFCHSAYIKFPNFISPLFVTPQSHEVHHNQNTQHQNSNFGGILSIWDHIFKTSHRNIKNVTPGIKGYSCYNILRIQTDPIINYFKNDKKNK